MAGRPKYNPYCFLAAHGLYERGEMPACEGSLVKVHLIPKQLLRREGVHDLWTDAVWVWACGGPYANVGYGSAGHHGAFDVERTIRLPRREIPASTERFAATVGLGWFLDRSYGERGHAIR